MKLKTRATGTITCKEMNELLGLPSVCGRVLRLRWPLAFLALVVFHSLCVLLGQHWSCCFLSTALHE